MRLGFCVLCPIFEREQEDALLKKWLLTLESHTLRVQHAIVKAGGLPSMSLRHMSSALPTAILALREFASVAFAESLVPTLQQNLRRFCPHRAAEPRSWASFRFRQRLVISIKHTLVPLELHIVILNSFVLSSSVNTKNSTSLLGQAASLDLKTEMFAIGKSH
eukprot:6467595-Amphidinium_carterae.2